MNGQKQVAIAKHDLGVADNEKLLAMQVEKLTRELAKYRGISTPNASTDRAKMSSMKSNWVPSRTGNNSDTKFPYQEQTRIDPEAALLLVTLPNGTFDPTAYILHRDRKREAIAQRRHLTESLRPTHRRWRSPRSRQLLSAAGALSDSESEAGQIRRSSIHRRTDSSSTGASICTDAGDNCRHSRSRSLHRSRSCGR
ncbi:unnamed protein product [Schistocephalus solidus]|uniref:Uncharacterized protein n=1 Tax=Schistocephalus solidus TaxID=70667 RepID=A0A183THW3_SCHSO|nr:unnamed protein product [Schistocephalus solidus]